MSVEAALFNYLSGISGIAAIVGTRIYPLEAPQNGAFPCITFQTISFQHTNSLEGSSGLGAARIQVNCWARNVAGSTRGYTTALALRDAVRDADPKLILYGLANSELTAAGEAAGLRVAHEAFAERAYDADGRLAPRGTPGAVIEGFDDALAQVRDFVRDGIVVARDGRRVPIRADTLCLHGDRADAADFARGLRAALAAEGVSIRAPGHAA